MAPRRHGRQHQAGVAARLLIRPPSLTASTRCFSRDSLYRATDARQVAGDACSRQVPASVHRQRRPYRQETDIPMTGRFAPNAAVPAGSIFGRFETCRPVRTMSDPRGRLEVSGPLSNDAIAPERKSTPYLTGQVLFYARAQFDAYDKRYIRSLHGNLPA